MPTKLSLDERCVRDTTLTLKELTLLWKREVYSKAKLIDPGDELHWESMALGWAFAKGIKSIDDAYEIYGHFIKKGVF